jgi:hypothetical protein
LPVVARVCRIVTWDLPLAKEEKPEVYKGVGDVDSAARIDVPTTEHATLVGDTIVIVVDRRPDQNILVVGNTVPVAITGVVLVSTQIRRRV